MRQGRFFTINRSRVVQRQVLVAGKRALAVHSRSRHHRWLIGFAFMLALVGSSGSVAAGPPIVSAHETGGAFSSESSHGFAAARLFDEVFSQQKPDVCIQLMAANAITHTPAGDFEGPAGFEQYVAQVRNGITEASVTIDDWIANGDLVTLRWTMSGLYLDRYSDQAAHGVQVEVQGLAILRFDNGMIAESWFQYDQSALVDQNTLAPGAPELCPPCREP